MLMVRLIYSSEIAETFVGPELQIKHNWALTQGTVILFHLFFQAAPATASVAAPLVPLNLKYIFDM